MEDTLTVRIATIGLKIILGLMFAYTAYKTINLKDEWGRTITPKLTSSLAFYFLMDGLSGLCFLLLLPEPYILSSFFRFISLALLAVYAWGVQKRFTSIG